MIATSEEGCSLFGQYGGSGMVLEDVIVNKNTYIIICYVPDDVISWWMERGLVTHKYEK